MGKGFITKLDYSDNRQIKQRERANTILSGTTTFGVDFSELTNGPDPNNSGSSESISSVYGTFSGNTGTTIFTFNDNRLNLADYTLSAITPSNSGITQTTGNVFTGNTPLIIDDNTVYLDYTGVSFTLIVTGMTDTGGGTYTGETSSVNVSILSAGTLDYTGRTIWVTVPGILSGQTVYTGKLNIGVTTGTSVNGLGIDNNGFVVRTSNVGDNFVHLSGDTMTGGLVVPSVSATTITATTLYGDGSNITNINPSSVTGFVHLSGDTMTGTLNVPILSASTISGDTLFGNGSNITGIDHNTVVTGLQGGTHNQYYHLTEAEYSTISGSGADTIWQVISNVISPIVPGDSLDLGIGTVSANKFFVGSGETNGIKFGAGLTYGAGANIYQSDEGDLFIKHDVQGDFEILIDNQYAGSSTQLVLKAKGCDGVLAAFSDTYGYTPWRNKLVLTTGGVGQGIQINSGDDLLINAGGYNVLYVAPSTRGVGLFTYGDAATASLEVRGVGVSTQYSGKFTDINKRVILGVRDDGNVELSDNLDIKTTNKGIVWSSNSVSIVSDGNTFLRIRSGAKDVMTIAGTYAAMGGHLWVIANNLFDLGSHTNRFKDGYLYSVNTHAVFINTTPTLDNTNDVILVRNPSTGKIDYRSASTLTPSLTTNRIAFGSATNLVSGSDKLTFIDGDVFPNSNTLTVGYNKLYTYKPSGQWNNILDLGADVPTGYTKFGSMVYLRGNDGTTSFYSRIRRGEDLNNNIFFEQSDNAGYVFSNSTGQLLNLKANGHTILYEATDNAFLNVKSWTNNGTKLLSLQGTSEVAFINDQGSAWLGGNYGVARLNITASGTGGASKIFSGYNNLNAEVFYILDNGTIKMYNLEGTTNRVLETNPLGEITGTKEFVSLMIDVSVNDSLSRNLVTGTWVGNSFERDGIEGQWGISGNYEYKCVSSMGLWYRYPSNKEYQDLYITDPDVISSLANEDNWDAYGKYIESGKKQKYRFDIISAANSTIILNDGSGVSETFTADVATYPTTALLAQRLVTVINGSATLDLTASQTSAGVDEFLYVESDDVSILFALGTLTNVSYTIQQVGYTWTSLSSRMFNGQQYTNYFNDYKYYIEDINSKTIVRTKIDETIYVKKIDVNSDQSFGPIIPSGYKVKNIIIEESTGTSDVEIKIGKTSGASDIVSTVTVTSNSFIDCTLLLTLFSLTQRQEVFISATAWTTSKVNVYIKLERVI